MGFRSFPAPHEIRALEPAKCWRSGCAHPARPACRGLCEAHWEQALDNAHQLDLEQDDPS